MCQPFIQVAGEGGLILAAPLITTMPEAIWSMIVTMTTVGYGAYYPKQAIGKFTAVVAAMFGTFYLAMPLTIIGTKFYEIYQDVEIEDREYNKKLDNIFGRSEAKRKAIEQKKGDEGLSVHALSKIKRLAAKTKSRVEEMSISDEERKLCVKYIEAIESVSRRE